MEAHDAAVATISQRLTQFHAARQSYRVYHGSTNSTRTTHRSSTNTVDTSALTHVLSIRHDNGLDPNTNRPRPPTAVCEPNVSMDVLLDATLKEGLVPLIVMELPSITVGGGFSGMAGESSSFKYGPFDSIVSSIEIVLPDGTVTRADRYGDKKDLFWAAACAFGTMGVVTLLEVQLRAVGTGYVEMDYICVKGFEEARRVLQEKCAQGETVGGEDVDYVDAIAFSPTDVVICVGRLVEKFPEGKNAGSKEVVKSKVRKYTGRFDPWYYLDVQKRTDSGRKSFKGDLVPVTDYFFRWDRGGFWVARYAFRYFLTPFNMVTRAVLDRFMHAKVMYHALHKSGLSDQYVIQDVGVPFGKAEEFRGWLDENFQGIYPLWLCPIKIRREEEGSGEGLHADFADPNKMPEPVLLNFGVWGPAPGCGGPGPEGYERFIELNRKLEGKVHEFGGKKTLYAQNFYTRDEFWGVYNKEKYDAVRNRYGAGEEWMRDVWDKVGHVDTEARKKAMEGSRMPKSLQGRRPWMGFYGVYKAWRGGDYLLEKKKKKGNGGEKGDEKAKAE